MLRSDLVTRLASRFAKLPTRESDLAVRTILEYMIHALASGNRTEIRGFGSFSVVYRRARTARNPKSGERVRVPPKQHAHFRPGKELRLRVDLALSVAPSH